VGDMLLTTTYNMATTAGSDLPMFTIESKHRKLVCHVIIALQLVWSGAVCPADENKKM
jgi:hypothetical protein